MPKTPDRRPSYDELAALVVRQMATIEAQRETIAQLEATVGRLSARVAELERRQSRNSGNSSLPPSSDTFVRPDKKAPVKSGRKRGRQPGAPGSGLAMVDTPDEVEDHVPAACGGALLNAIPPVRGRRGRPRQRPKTLYADRGYDHDKYRRMTWAKGVKPLIARRGTPHGSGLGTHRWVIEQTIALLHWFRRLRIRWEIRADMHEAFMTLAAAIICWCRLTR